MDTKKLDRWASLLLDTGKRNNLVNFKDTKASTVEIVLPDADILFNKVESSNAFEVFDPKIVDDEEEDYRDNFQDVELGEVEGENKPEKLNRQQYIDTYSPKIKMANQILLYNANVNPVNALKKIDKKAREHVEETGVNVAYIAFGFVHWKESEDSKYVYRAPILLAPISFSNESSVSPWYIKMTDDDIVVNPTFSFKLEAEHGIKMPEYEEGSLASYLEQVEKHVSKLGWKVTKECKIAIFSFLKINMYRDLMDHKETILQNNNVRMLLGESYDKGCGVSIEQGEHHLDNPLIELHNVVDADSSQIEAIEMAKAGVSFVLQGPPGTGKSQTITNIIAECINDGKKVLFVSEKQAALNVVYDKLRKAGLEEFCLELHSYKSNKKDVIDVLCNTLRAKKTAVSSKAVQEIENKAKSQKELDAYEIELHKKREVINKSLYQLYNAYSACRKAPEVKVTIQEINKKGDDYLHTADALLKQYEDFVPSIGYRYKQNPWYGYVNDDTSYQMREEIKESLEIAIEALNEYISLQNLIEEKYGICCNTLKQTALLENYFQLAANSNILTPSFLTQTACSYMLEKITQLKNLAQDIMPIRESINAEYDSDIYKMDANNAYKRLTRQYTNRFGRLFNSEYKKLIADIRINKKDGKKPSYDTAVKLMNNLSIFQAKSAEFAEIETPIKEAMGVAYVGVDSDWEILLSQIEQLKSLFSAGASFGKLEVLTKIEYEDNKSEFAVLANKINRIKEMSKSKFDLLVKSFDSHVFDMQNEKFTDVLDKIQVCLEEYDRVDNWCRFNDLLKKLGAYQLVNFLDLAIEANVPANVVSIAYQKNFYRQWIDYVQHLTLVLSTFNRIAHDSQVEAFGKQDSTQFEISKVQIKSELSSKRPSLDLLSSGSAVSILLREGEKKRRQKSIRLLMEEAGELIQVIKPCFLMSPLSVSTFLNTEKIKFDVVVFDEASQIFPQDAIGAIYRGKQLIVVGDSKQMPPSNFFSSSVDMDDSDEETGDITDFESILDLCSASFAQLRLRWHYRSRFEQLITFSNKNFYDSDLVTFPSSVLDRHGVGVDYYFADGVFDHKTRNNRKEAEFIVDLIFKNIDKYPERSLGVVAFSVSQQDLIERLLSKRRQEDTSKEWFFRQDAPEPFFVKNLETVQGDERDTIIFSVAYAKDSTGRLMHNFGPLNRVGGERRLNVAVTRAKLNVQLVASIHHTDIDLKRTSAEGARLLKEYLDYAENGGIALERAVTVDQFEQFDSEFELEVCEFLREHGFEVDTQVGCSNFKIDLGLKKPESSDYVLAIECDGATYHSSKNARDRDRLRQQILESMGWKFYRIWSTDWFKNTSVEKERLLEAAKTAILGDDLEILNSKQNEKEEKVEESYFEETVQEEHFEFSKYREADLNHIYTTTVNLQSFVKNVMILEAPLSEEWLLKRIPWMFGREKVTSVVQQQYERQMFGCERNGIIRRNGFLYLQDQTDYELRIPVNKEVKRDIKYICREELAAGMLVIINQNVSVEKEGLFRSIANVLGFQRVADNIEAKLDDALEVLQGQVEMNGNIISVKK